MENEHRESRLNKCRRPTSQLASSQNAAPRVPKMGYACALGAVATKIHGSPIYIDVFSKLLHLVSRVYISGFIIGFDGKLKSQYADTDISWDHGYEDGAAAAKAVFGEGQ